MSALPKVISPGTALVKARTMLYEMGFHRVGSGSGSTYFGKIGTHHKIRVSNHASPKRRHDYVYSIEFLGPTIVNDVEFQVKKAVEAFEVARRPKFGSRAREGQ